MGEMESMRKWEGPTVVTVSSSDIKNEPIVKYLSPSLNNRSRKRTRNNFNVRQGGRNK